MKKLLSSILMILLLFSLAGCSQQQAAETDMSLPDMAAAIQASQQGLPNLIRITPEDADFTTWLSDYYLLRAEQVTDGIICYADGVEASEIAVLLLEDENNCKEARDLLNEYMQNRADIFEGYAPEQAALVKNGIVEARGRYLALLICPKPSEAKEAFGKCFGNGAGGSGSRERDTDSGNDAAGKSDTDIGKDTADESGAGEKTAASSAEPEVPSESAGAEDSYNAEAVLEAWRSGDDSSLSEMNKRILDAAKDVIESEVDDGMSDYEKELAIHDFITGWSRFDYSVFGRSASGGFGDGSDTPYGVLINQSAMCHGYSSTFQLFMDMLDIECITVFGIPGSNGVEHSWNMVKLDGEWYCVDCAWDDPLGGRPGHTYFNVTSDYLRGGSIHRWDETSVPEATGTAYAYDKNE